MYIRPIIVLFILLAGETSFGQEKKGLIVDPDGFTNVRDAPSGSAEIISRIVDGEVFSYSKSNKSWYPVNTYKGVEGFVHKSRIKEFKITKDLRLNKNMEELLVYTEAYKVISVCGNAYKKTDDSQLYSGLIVGDGLNQTIYQEFFEGAIQSFEFKNGQIYIYEYANLPATDKLENELIPFALSRVFLIGDRIINISKSPYYNFPKINDEKISKIINELKSKVIPQNDIYSAIETSMLLALNNQNLSEDFFYNLQSELDIIFDGEYAEKYQKALLVYEINRKNR